MTSTMSRRLLVWPRRLPSASAARRGFAARVDRHPSALATADLRYELPSELIAQNAVEPRDAARLLIALPRDGIMDSSFSRLPSLLPPRSRLVINESAVFSARLRARAEPDTEAAEVMLLGPEPPTGDASAALQQPAHGQLWRAMIRLPLEKAGQRLLLAGGGEHHAMALRVEQLLGEWNEEGEGGGVEAAVRFEAIDEGGGRTGEANVHLLQLFEECGETPLPPYIRRAPRPDDRERYQSVYAAADRAGSVAAPTAGLHFTQRLLDELDVAGVRTSRVALHVSAGTFKPVTAQVLGGHHMHSERFTISADTLHALAGSCREGEPIIAVGTTSARVLESVYWLGLQHASRQLGKAPHATPPVGAAPARALELGHLDQWSGSPDDSAHAVGGLGDAAGALPSMQTVFEALATSASAGGLAELGGTTSLCIAPGYRFRVCDGLLTNFHAPDSTLMALVAAMSGGPDRIHDVYRHAIDARYRFLSYGDASLLVHHDPQHERPGATALAAAITAASDTSGGGGSAAGAGAAAGAAAGEMGRGVAMAMPEAGSIVRKVLLHSCCAPCSGAMVEAMVGAGHDVTIFFYNPNIHPRREYEIRKNENKRYAEKLGIDFVDVDGDVDEWYRRAKGMEFCPERGTRCSMCFDMRLERTALHAYENGFDSFTTTNATSRWKDEAQVNDSGVRAAAKYAGVEYWLSDWQTEQMTQLKYKINASERFYKQEYCGCSYSLRDSNHFRAKQGQPPVQIGGESYYSDPVADEAEESVELVADFFAQSEGFEEELKHTYATRRKDGSKHENW